MYATKKYSKLYQNFNKINNLLVKKYHSDGVFGFKGKKLREHTVLEEVLAARREESNFYRLITAFREHGHKQADINPVAFSKNVCSRSELEPQRYGLKENDQVNFKHLINLEKDKGTVEEALEFLNDAYTKHISAEFAYMENEDEVEWFSKRFESINHETLDNETRLTLAEHLLKSQAFDNFLAIKYTGLKRYGGEGAESMMAFFSELFKLSANDTIEQLIFGMPHRGRLNLLTGMLNFQPRQLFAKLKGNADFPKKYKGSGDVISHCIVSTDLKYENGEVHVSVLYNPSHLEAVNPVSMGKTRSKQMTSKDGDYGENSKWGDKVVNVQVHGDAALMGQGVNQECLAMCKTPHFEVGGTIHMVVNNQVGFTTPSDRERSSRYCTDLAKMISAPVVHVNGDYPELVLKATRLVFEYQRKFRRDIFLDINCYRQWGHNELDDPTFTNPALYSIIKSRGTVPDLYAQTLISEGLISKEKTEEICRVHTEWLNSELKAADNYEPKDPVFQKQWNGFGQATNDVTTWDTGLHMDLLTHIGSKSVRVPQDFEIHPTLQRTHVKNRLSTVADGTNINWGTAEAIAIGSLLYNGFNVRLSGQDVGRCAFSHRHVMLVDQKTNNIHIPLNNIIPNQQAHLEIANSILSEFGVLGYEYGMSVDNPYLLNMWEAQFGDFHNGAQIIFDTFISNGEAKWLWSSGLTILLPHGYDGAGPDHSSCRLERFLQLTNSQEGAVDSDDVNMQVCQPSTPAQYFHLLRRQMIRNFRKPLIIVSPKTLLRLSAATSDFSEMMPGTSFKPVIGDQMMDPAKVERVLITSGKHYYTLLEKRQSMNNRDTAIIRLESFCPFPTYEFQQELQKYSKAKAVVWCQEEPQNMGAWTFVKPRFQNLLGKNITYCGRKTMSACAVAVGKIHQQEVIDISTKPFLIN